MNISCSSKILTFDGIQRLKLVTLHCTIKSHSSAEDASVTTQATIPSTAAINSVDDLTRMYPQQFDRIGYFPGEVNLVVDPAVPPRVNPPRNTPIALKDAIISSLDSMVEDDVIRKVHNEPAEWVSSLAYAKKKDGSLRMCLDPKFSNQALKRPHHNIPTLEELNHKFTGARYFSKLDAEAGYWGVQLHKDSQLLTTFLSPYGRYAAFKRLLFGLSASQDTFQSRMDMTLEQCDGAEGIADDVVV